jgi:excisionase family DNA binding protein
MSLNQIGAHMKNGIQIPPVLTTTEVAKYLRLPKAKVLRLAEAGDLPAREIDGEWRFLKAAIDEWLGRPDPTQQLLRQAGMWANDDTYPELCRSINENRRRDKEGER